MDQFEAAKNKHAKNLERRLRNQAAEEIDLAEVVYIEREASEEKEEKTDAVIDVKVSLPNGDISMRFVKPGVFQNANVSRLTKKEFTNRIIEGLRPLLGEVKAL